MDVSALAKSIAESGVQHLQSAVQGTRLLASISVASPKGVERDETHYLLLPYPGLDDPYVVFTKRMIPEGVGITNSLPKVRVFHVPDASGNRVLEDTLVSQSLKGADLDTESEFADRLELLAEDIDRETERISGGLVLVGGAIAFINPLVGIGVAAHGLLPSVGAKASKAGADYVGKKIREWNKGAAEARVRKEVRREIKQFNREIFPNPLLQSLDAVITNPDVEFDPILSDRDWVREYDDFRYFRVTVEAVAQAYEPILNRYERTELSPLALQWIAHLAELSEV